MRINGGDATGDMRKFTLARKLPGIQGVALVLMTTTTKATHEEMDDTEEKVIKYGKLKKFLSCLCFIALKFII